MTLGLHSRYDMFTQIKLRASGYALDIANSVLVMAAIMQRYVDMADVIDT